MRQCISLFNDDCQGAPCCRVLHYEGKEASTPSIAIHRRHDEALRDVADEAESRGATFLKKDFRGRRRTGRAAKSIADQFAGDFGVAAQLPLCPVLVGPLRQAIGKAVQHRQSAWLQPNHGHFAPLLQQQIEKNTCCGLELSAVTDHEPNVQAFTLGKSVVEHFESIEEL